MVVYRCWFNFELDEAKTSVVVSEEGIGRFANGFWITETMKLTKGADCKYWIPPNQILLIEKGAM
jgi:hypothetical protein